LEDSSLVARHVTAVGNGGTSYGATAVIPSASKRRELCPQVTLTLR
jgi:hypothetical protein